MKKEDFDYGLPVFVGEYANKVLSEIDDAFFNDSMSIYFPVLDILYHKDKKKEDKLEQFKMIKAFSDEEKKSISKKNLLLKILQSNSPSDGDFLKKLKIALPNGIHFGYICTDSEYEALKREFDNLTKKIKEYTTQSKGH